MRGDRQKRVAISHLPDNCPPKLAPLERLPKRHRVGPSASLDESIRNLLGSYTLPSLYIMMGEGCQINITACLTTNSFSACDCRV